MANQTAQNLAENDDSTEHMASVSGRPMHENWHGYKKVYVNGKVAANCLNCLKTFSNTAKSRLQTHRLVVPSFIMLIRFNILRRDFY